MIRTGFEPDGTRMLPQMPYAYLANITGDSMAAIILYLRALPPLPDGGH